MKVAIYVRLSQEDIDKTSKDEDSKSIKNQKDMLIKYCVTKDWEIFDIYSDDDYTGADRDRPEFNRLLKDAKEQKFDIILCKTQSRFTRELELVEKYIHTLFPLWGIRFVSIVDNADTENKGNKKSRQINGLVNEWYLEDMSDSIRAVFKSKSNNGLHIGSFACYGYMKDKERKGKLIVDKEAAMIVKEIFEMYDSGLGQVTICRTLNDRGVPNPANYKKQKGLHFKTRGGNIKNNWITTTVSTILKNETYIGNLVQHKKENISYKSKKQRTVKKEDWIIVKGTHEAIVSVELFNRVQLKLKERQRSLKNGKKNKYAGILVCMYCGMGMYTNTWREERYFRCRQSVTSKKCTGPLIKESVLDDIVLSQFKKISKELLDKNEVEKQLVIEDRRKEKIKKIESIILDSTRQIEKTNEILKNIYLDKLNGTITQNDYITFSSSFVADKERIESNLESYREQKEIVLQEQFATISKDKLIEQFMLTDTLTFEMVSELVDKIELGKILEEGEKLPIKIHWKF